MSQLTLKCAKFCLSRGLDDLLSSGDLVDVTLSCQGEFIQAHKTVLAACSAHFRSIFKLQPWQHPVVFMHDLDLAQLKALINFMYNGEVTIEETDLPDFLKLADALKVSGLTLKEKETAIPLPEVQNMISNPVAPSSPTPPPAKKRRRSQDGDVSRLAPSPVVPPAAPTNEDSTPQVNIKLEEEEVADLLSQFQDDPLNNQECKAEELADLSDNDLIDAQVCLADDEDDLQLDESTQEDDSWFETGPSTSQQSSCVPNIDVQSSRQQPVATAVSSRGRKIHRTAKAKQIREENYFLNEGCVNICQLCNRIFKSENLLQEHLKKRHKDQSNTLSQPDPLVTRSYFECVHCPSKFIHKDSLSRHIEVMHINVSNYVCQECNLTFPSQMTLSQHNVILHFNPTHVYRCNFCKLGFKRRQDLREHLKKVHNSSSKYGLKTFQCAFCLAEFQTGPLKIEHLKLMHPETRFPCRVCPADFYAKDERLRHEINIHRVNVDKPDQLYICEICDKPFSTKRFFLLHKATHSQ